MRSAREQLYGQKRSARALLQQAAGAPAPSGPDDQTSPPPSNRTPRQFDTSGPFGPNVLDVAKGVFSGLATGGDRIASGLIDPVAEKHQRIVAASEPGMERAGSRLLGQYPAGIANFFVRGVPDFANRFVNPEEYGSTGGEQVREAGAGLLSGFKKAGAQFGEEVHQTARDFGVRGEENPMKQIYSDLGADKTFEEGVAEYNQDPSGWLQTAMIGKGLANTGVGLARGGTNLVRRGLNAVKREPFDLTPEADQFADASKMIAEKAPVESPVTETRAVETPKRVVTQEEQVAAQIKGEYGARMYKNKRGDILITTPYDRGLDRVVVDKNANIKSLGAGPVETAKGQWEEVTSPTPKSPLAPPPNAEQGAVAKPLAPVTEMPKSETQAPAVKQPNLITAYHGTKYKFENFDPAQRGKLTKAESAKNAFFFTDKEDVARGYADMGDSPSVEVLQKRHEQLEKIAQRSRKSSDWAKAQKALEKYEDAALGDENRNFSGEIKKVNLDIRNPLVVDKGGYAYEEKELANWVREAKAKGHDAVIIKNAADAVNTPIGGGKRPDSELSTVYAVLSEKQILSKELTNEQPRNSGIGNQGGVEKSGEILGRGNRGVSDKNEGIAEQHHERAGKVLGGDAVQEGKPVELSPAPVSPQGGARGKQPPVEPPKPPAPVEQPKYPEKTGSANAVQDELRKTMDFDALPEHRKIGYAEAGKEAERLGMVDDAPGIAQDIVSQKRPHTALEEAGMRIRQAKTIDKARQLGKEIDAAVAKGSEGGFVEAEKLIAERDVLHQEISDISDAMRVGGSETGRALGQRNAMNSTYEPYSLENIVRKATVAKRGKLTAEEVAKYEKLANDNAELTRKVQEISDREAQRVAELEKKLAERRISVEVKKARITSRSRIAKDKIVDERNRIKKQLQDLGYRVNDITGVTAEGAYLAGRLAITYIKEGVFTLDEVVRKVLADMPTLTEADVWRSINAKDPGRIAHERSLAQKRLAEIKTEANLLTQIDNAGKGVFESTGPKAPQNFVLLRRQLNDLRNQAYRSGADGLKREKIIQKTNELQAQVDGMYRNIKKGKQPLPSDVQEAQTKYNEVKRLMNATDEVTKLNEQLRTGDFPVKKAAKPTNNPELERAQIELSNLRRRVRSEIENQKGTTTGKVFHEVVSGLRTARAMGEMSTVFRQNVVQVFSHPIRGAQSFGPSFKAFFRPETFERLQNNIQQSPNYINYQRSKLKINDMDHVPGKTEEFFNGSALEKIPYYGAWVKASNRHMTIFGNLMRTSLFDDFLVKNPRVSAEQMGQYSHFLNVSSGIGDLGKFAQAADYLSLGFFAPKLAVSRFQTPALLAKYWKDPIVRKAMARDLAGFVATGTTVLGVSAIAGATVGKDPSDPDWGKIRFGDTRIDIWGGFLQPARLVARIGQSVTTRTGLTPDEKQTDPVQLIGQFASYKFAPNITITRELITGKTGVGEKTTVAETFANSVVPMFLKDIYDAYQQEGLGRAVAVAPLTTLGIGVSTYPDSEAATRQKIRELKDRGDIAKADELKGQWNKNNPKERIVEVKTTQQIKDAEKVKENPKAELPERQKRKLSGSPLSDLGPAPEIYSVSDIDKIPQGLFVRVDSIGSKTGKRVKVRQNAREAITELHNDLELYGQLREMAVA